MAEGDWESTGMPRYIALHRCVFYKLKARASTSRDCRSLYCSAPFIAVVWNRTPSISEVCLCSAENRGTKWGNTPAPRFPSTLAAGQEDSSLIK